MHLPFRTLHSTLSPWRTQIAVAFTASCWRRFAHRDCSSTLLLIRVLPLITVSTEYFLTCCSLHRFKFRFNKPADFLQHSGAQLLSRRISDTLRLFFLAALVRCHYRHIKTLPLWKWFLSAGRCFHSGRWRLSLWPLVLWRLDSQSTDGRDHIKLCSSFWCRFFSVESSPSLPQVKSSVLPVVHFQCLAPLTHLFLTLFVRRPGHQPLPMVWRAPCAFLSVFLWYSNFLPAAHNLNQNYISFEYSVFRSYSH